MATTKLPVTSQESATAQADTSVKDAATAQAKVRSEVLKSLLFSDVASLVLTLAHWSDVLGAADALAKRIADGAHSEKTVSSQARKLGSLYPSDCAILRLAVTSYQLSGRRCNPTQAAELAAKLPSLRKVGTLKGNEITFGSIVLPPCLGEF